MLKEGKLVFKLQCESSAPWWLFLKLWGEKIIRFINLTDKYCSSVIIQHGENVSKKIKENSQFSCK